jgi:GDP-4-dehydro-6-deoxy-D-mannose reductase
MNKKTLVLGGTGFVGQYVAQIFKDSCDLTVVGSEVDVRNRKAIKDLLLSQKFDFVVNLAAISSVPDSFTDPKTCWDVNFGGTLNILLELENTNFSGSFLFVSSGQVYGQVSDEQLPIREDNICQPTNPYGQSKLAAENLCTSFAKFSQFKIITARPFNHVGYGQSEKFVVPTIISQMKRATIDNCEELILGDITSTRDFLHVTDVARAYLALLWHGQNGEIYNVCSGIETSIEKIVSELFKIESIELSIKRKNIAHEDKTVHRVVGDNSKILKHTQWIPNLDLQTTLKECLSPTLRIN